VVDYVVIQWLIQLSFSGHSWSFVVIRWSFGGHLWFANV